MRFFKRSCPYCGKPADELRVAEHLSGRHGDVEVEFRNFPYRSCACGKLTRWAFDPGLEFSEQLFYDGIPAAKGSTRNPTCASCGGELGARQPVQLEAEARLDGFAPIQFRARLNGYRCESCGLEQAPKDAFEADGSDGARALAEATRSIRLK